MEQRFGVCGVLVTYRRPQILEQTLDAIDGQSDSLDHIIVVDNDPAQSAREIIEGRHAAYSYIATGANLGPAGGLRAGVDEIGEDWAWVMFLDDDDPPPGQHVFENSLQFLMEAVERDPKCGGVGTAGALFNRRWGRSRRPDMRSDTRYLKVDWIGGGQFPIYSVAALRKVGAPDPSTFWGYDDLDLGLRLIRANYALYRDRDYAPEVHTGPRVEGRDARPATWRLYYTSRNLVSLMRRESSLVWAVIAGSRAVLAAFGRSRGQRMAAARASLRGVVGALCGESGWSSRAGGPTAH